MEKVNWGIVGLGNIAEKFIDGFKYVDNAIIKGIASKNLNKLSKFKKDLSINEKYCFENYIDLIQSKDIDIIYITLPHSLHYEHIIECLNLDKNVVVEKPATVNFEQIKSEKNILDKKQIFFAEAFMYRFHPQTTKIIELIRNNYIGNLLSMKSFFGVNIMKKKYFFGFNFGKKINKNNRLYNKKLGGGAILDLGCYPSSMSLLIASLKSKYSEVKVEEKKLEFYETGVDINSYAKLSFDNNFESYIGTSFIEDIGKKTIIEGNKGKITIEDSWHGNPSKIIISGKYNKVLNIDAKENIYAYEIEKISKNILENNFKIEYPGLDIDETCLNMEILDNWLNNEK